MAPPPPTWADLPPELVSCIAGRLASLRSYLAARGACKAWLAALDPASPYVLRVCRIRDKARAAAVSLPLRRRSFHLSTISSYSQCVGSGHGWLAVVPYRGSDVVLFNPLVTGRELKLVLPSFYPPHRVVFAPNPSVDDFAAVVTWVAGAKLLAYVSARDAASSSAACSFEEIAVDAAPVDVVYHAGGGWGGRKFYCLFKTGEVRVLRVPRDLQTKPVLEPLLDGCVMSDPSDVFAPPHTRLPDHRLAKHLVFCGTNLYQVWRYTGGAVDLQLPEGGSVHVSNNEVFVLRYAPARHPRWEAVGHLGGHSVFIGVNNAVSVHAEGMAGLKGNCVYWVGQFEFAEAMVFDMRTRRSTLCLAPFVSATGWYF